MKAQRIHVIVLRGGTGQFAFSTGLRAQHSLAASLLDGLHAPVHTFRSTGEATWHPFTDVLETDAAFVIRMELAGLEAEQIEVLKDGRCLIVRGQREDPWRHAGVTCHQIEIAHGRFERVIALPIDFHQDDVHAECGNTGFLEITVPKERS